jgi:hypothetical protein
MRQNPFCKVWCAASIVMVLTLPAFSAAGAEVLPPGNAYSGLLNNPACHAMKYRALRARARISKNYLQHSPGWYDLCDNFILFDRLT